MHSRRTFSGFMWSHMSTLIVSYLFIVAFTYVAFNVRYRVEADTKIQVFSITDGIKDDYSDTMQNALKGVGVKEVLLRNYSSTTPKLSDIFLAIGAQSDFHIIDHQTLVDMQDLVEDYYLPLSNELINEIDPLIAGKYTYFEYETTPYGFCLYSEITSYNDNFDFLNYYDVTTDNEAEITPYYLLINKDSVNILGYNEIATTTKALSALNWLLGWFCV